MKSISVNMFEKTVTLLFTVAFLVHISWLLYFMMNPPLPDIEMSKVNLVDIEFPIVMKICLYDVKNSWDRYEMVGYGDARKLFTGRSRFNESQDGSNLYGWRGFSENGKPIGSVEGKNFKKGKQVLS